MTEVVKEAQVKEKIAPEDLIAVKAAKETVDIFAKQRIMVRDTNPITLMGNLQTLIQQGCELDVDAYPQLRTAVVEVKLIKHCNINDLEADMIESFPGVHASPIAHTEFAYDEEFVKALPWETFKNLLKAVGIGGRDRQKMTRQYLDYCENLL